MMRVVDIYGLRGPVHLENGDKYIHEGEETVTGRPHSNGLGSSRDLL